MLPFVNHLFSRIVFQKPNWLRIVTLFFATVCLLPRANGQLAVITQHNDAARTGSYLQESHLTTSNVNVNQFGRLFVRLLDGHVYAQPLYVPSVVVPQFGTHNVVYVATAHNTVYAYDADDPKQSTPLWSRNLGPSVPSSLINTPNIQVEVGIIGTPVIAVSRNAATGINTGTLYVAAKTLENNTQIYRLHALDISTGNPVYGSPVQIAATVPGKGDGGTSVTFRASQQCNRPGLLYLNGSIFLAFASHEDYTPYHGWILGYNAKNLLAQPMIFNTTPNGGLGGIWMGGQGLTADASGSIYCMVGNGSSDAKSGGNGYGETFLKLTVNNKRLALSDWFMPFDADDLNNRDADLGSGGPFAIPNTHLIVGGGKSGKLYLVDTTHMGKFNATADTQIVQSFNAYNGEYRGGFVYWNSPNNGPQVYVWGGSDYGKAYVLRNGMFVTTPSSQTTIQVSNGASNSPGMSISANQSHAGTGILWAAMSSNGDSDHLTVPGVLRAFDASNLAKELWDSDQYPERDSLGNWAKFCPPTIANGKVYMATDSGQLCVYGLVPPIKAGTGTTISINFVGGGPNGNPSVMGGSEVAGVVAKSFWNNAGTSASGSLPLLLDDSGGATTGKVAWACDNLWSLGITETPGNARMMKGYLDTGAMNPTTVTVSNLSTTYTKYGYDVYVYCDGDNGGSNRTGSYAIGGTTITATDSGNTDFSGTFLKAVNGAGNYIVFPNLTANTFTLTATPGPADDGTRRAPVNGIQIVAHTSH